MKEKRFTILCHFLTSVISSIPRHQFVAMSQLLMLLAEISPDSDSNVGGDKSLDLSSHSDIGENNETKDRVTVDVAEETGVGNLIRKVTHMPARSSFFTPHGLSIKSDQSNIALHCVIPKMKFHVCAAVQRYCINHLSNLRHTMGNSSFDCDQDIEGRQRNEGAPQLLPLDIVSVEIVKVCFSLFIYLVLFCA